MKIYTKTGDKGSTSLVSGTRTSKTDLRVETYGTVDELNAQIGVLVSELEKVGFFPALCQQLFRIQNRLFNAGSILACEDQKIIASLPPLSSNHISELEQQMDEWTKDLAPLSQFILPGGSAPAAHSQVCRTVCRRAERLVVELLESLPESDRNSQIQTVLTYTNRLSDYFFVASRWINHKMQRPDVTWQKDL